MRESGKTIKNLALVSFIGRMVLGTKESGGLIRSADWANFFMVTGISMLEIGEITLKRVKERITLRAEISM